LASTPAGVLVPDHRSGWFIVIAVTATVLPAFSYLIEVLFEVLIEVPHPRRGHVFLGQVLVPAEDRLCVPDGELQVARDVLYALTA
jgi:hypothetical protein